MWAWLAYMVPQKLTWGFAFDFPFAELVAVATIMGWLRTREPKALPVRAVTVLLIALGLWVSLTTVFALVPNEAVTKWDRVVKILVTTLLTMTLLTSKKRIEGLVWVIALSLGFYGAKGGVYFLTGGRGLVFGPPGGLFGDNTSLALALIMVIPFMRYLQLQSDRLWLRLGAGGVTALSFAAAVGSYSRGALVGGIAMGLALVLSSRKRVLLIVLAIVAIVAAAPLVPERWVYRMETIKDYQEDGSAMGRIEAWTFAWRLALDRPITGGGFLVNRDRELFFKYVPDAITERAFHSNYFEVLGEHGFVGLGIYLALMFAALANASSVIRAAKGRKELLWASDLARMMRVSIVGYAVSGMFLNLAFFDLYYHVIAIIFCTKLLVERASAPALAPEPIGPPAIATQVVAR